MARDGVGFTGRLTATAALGVAPVRAPGGEGEEDGEVAAAAAAAAAAASFPLPARKDRPSIMRKLADAGWLVTGRGALGGDGGRAGRAAQREGEGGGGGGGGPRGSAAGTWYGIGPRSFAELVGLLVGETEATEERKAAWNELF